MIGKYDHSPFVETTIRDDFAIYRLDLLLRQIVQRLGSLLLSPETRFEKCALFIFESLSSDSVYLMGIIRFFGRNPYN